MGSSLTIDSSRPGAFDDAARLLDRDLPERQHVVIRAAVEAAEIAVAEILADFLRVHQPQSFAVDHRLAAFGGGGIGDPRPREILHPPGAAVDPVELQLLWGIVMRSAS